MTKQLPLKISAYFAGDARLLAAGVNGSKTQNTWPAHTGFQANPV
jgi:hypothetical protein